METVALVLMFTVAVLALAGYGPLIVRGLRDTLAERRRRRMHLNPLESLWWEHGSRTDEIYLSIVQEEIRKDARWAAACERGGQRLVVQQKGTAGRR